MDRRKRTSLEAMVDAKNEELRRMLLDKKAMLAEEHKVRERLSRDHANTIHQISNIETAIRRLRADHLASVEAQQAASRAELSVLEQEVAAMNKQRLALERYVVTFDIVDQEHATLKARLRSLKESEGKEAQENAAELEGLKSSVFQLRTRLDEVFRKTLAAVQGQTKDSAMVEVLQEAREAHDHAAQLAKTLKARTATVARVLQAHAQSRRALMQVRVDRDITADTVKAQADRISALDAAVAAQEADVTRRERELQVALTRQAQLATESADLQRLGGEVTAAQRACAAARDRAVKARHRALRAARAGGGGVSSSGMQRSLSLPALRRSGIDTVDTESDRDYKAAEERFLVFRAQLLEIIQNTEQFRSRLKESIAVASKLSQNFLKVSQGEGDSGVALDELLFVDLDKYVLSDLKIQHESYNDINKLVKERYELKVELQHYSDKVQELNDNPKVAAERKVRNEEKYATANTRLREQTDALLRRFAESEVRRRRVLEEDLPRIMDLKRLAYAALATNAEKAAQGLVLAPMRSGSRGSSSAFGSKDLPGSARGSYDNTVTGQGAESARMSDVPLGGTSSQRTSVNTDHGASSHALTAKPAAAALLDSPPSHLYKRASGSMESVQPGGNAGGVVGQSSHSGSAAAAASEDVVSTRTALEQNMGATAVPVSQEVFHEASYEQEQEPVTAAATPEANAADANASRTEPEVVDGGLGPGYMRVRALYDFEAAEEGDLNFKANDIIVTDASRWSADGWVTGTCNGQTGQFPSNYTERID
ncbi:hypothetical protein JKP88DRAFT_347993 [Tribonema minus]|uniref:SH3 domain-containing protein n=1 Tax=Tribonema minus TaxID=303371 RepID=A0A836CJ66_9STRA|nr:hypothetical protein JKP88DRAFT_347993 [Tribonema minus]